MAASTKNKKIIAQLIHLLKSVKIHQKIFLKKLNSSGLILIENSIFPVALWAAKKKSWIRQSHTVNIPEIILFEGFQNNAENIGAGTSTPPTSSYSWRMFSQTGPRHFSGANFGTQARGNGSGGGDDKKEESSHKLTFQSYDI